MEITLIIFAFLMLLVGIVCVFMPVVPGPLLAWCGPLVYFIFTSTEAPLPYVNKWTIVVAGALVLFSFIFDYLASYWGAVKFGATWKGGVGALIGALVFPMLLAPVGFGFPGAIAGLLIGPIIGAFLGEYISGNTCGGSVRAGLGTLAGAIAATLVKLFVCFLMLAWLIISLVVNIGGNAV